MKAETGLVEYVKDLPREQLERKFLLRKMQDQEQNYTEKVRAWLAKPEQALITGAENHLRNSKIKLG